MFTPHDMKSMCGIEIGELLIRGACVYQSLWRDISSSMTNIRLPGDGWLHSGVVAAFNNDGTLCMLGNKSCLLRLSDVCGDIVFLDRMENKYVSSCPLIGQLWVYPVTTLDAEVTAPNPCH